MQRANGGEAARPRGSARADETVQDALAAGLLEVDLELVALDAGDGAIAEFGVEDAHADGDVATAGIAEADRAGARLDDAGRGRGEAAAPRGALPARTARAGAGEAALGPQRVGEGIGALRPVGAPQALAAGHRRLLLDMRRRQFGDEARGDRTRPLAVDAPVRGMENGAAAARARDRDIGEPSLLLEAGVTALVERALRREHAFLPAGEKDGVELQPLGGVDGHDRDLVGL